MHLRIMLWTQGCVEIRAKSVQLHEATIFIYTIYLRSHKLHSRRYVTLYAAAQFFAHLQLAASPRREMS